MMTERILRMLKPLLEEFGIPFPEMLNSYAEAASKYVLDDGTYSNLTY